MKNKFLVLTLAFAMMLSFMPMASFAASDHDDTHYTYEIYIWDNGTTFCTTINDNDETDNEYHSVTGTGEVQIWCEDCEMMVDSYPYESEGNLFPHEYDENGICSLCGHYNTCPHENTYDEYYWEEGEATCTPAGNKYHKVTGTGEKETWCEDCGMLIDSDPSYVFNGREEILHDYDEDRYCELCGHTNTCPHDSDNKEEMLIWGDDTEWTSVDDEYHSVTGKAERQIWCEDCGMMIDSEECPFDGEQFPHDYDEDGYCETCGHIRSSTCAHVNIYEEYFWDEGTTFVSVDDEYHNVTGTGVKETWCGDCGTLIRREKISPNGENYPHEYDENDFCENCGHTFLDERICGSSRYDTALLVADKIKAKNCIEKFDYIIVAYGENYPDALSGGYLASVKYAPILLVRPSVESKIANYIKDNITDGGTVYLLGGTGAVSASFETNLENSGIYTKRLGGKNRYETNLEILKEAEVDNEDILVCTGTGYADSLSASAADWPILLVGGTLTDDQKNYIRSLNTDSFYLIGGEGAVKPKIESDLKNLGFGRDSIKRIAGSTRYETSTAVAEEFFAVPNTVVLAYAKNFPDGLSGGPLAIQESAPIILVDSNNKNIQAAKEYVAKEGTRRSITLGGTSLISDAAVKTIMGR